MFCQRLLPAIPGLFFLIIPLLGFSQQALPVHYKNARLMKRQPGDPLAHLPVNIQVLSYFGERADISPDSKRVAFMSKSFGDALLIDIKTKKLTCLTCNIPAAAFTRVMHLPGGGYLLTGPDHFENIQVSKTRDSELWYLSNEKGAKPVKIGLRQADGMAVSKTGPGLVYTEFPDSAGVHSRLIAAELDFSGSTPKIIHKKIILESKDSACRLEAQDFYNNDTQVTFFCYVPNGAFEVKGIDINTGQVTNFSNYPGAFNEPEGIFPGGKYTTVEMDRQCEWLGGERGSGNIDIWKMKLDGSGKDVQRLTFFNDYEGGKAANPVVAANGNFMCFQAASAADPPGVGHGILIYWFKK